MFDMLGMLPLLERGIKALERMADHQHATRISARHIAINTQAIAEYLTGEKMTHADAHIERVIERSA